MTVRKYAMKWGPGNTPYREARYGSPDESLSSDGSMAMRTYFTPYESRPQATLDFLGQTILNQSGDYLYPSRQIPHYHPDYKTTPYTDFPNLVVPYIYAQGVRHVGKWADGVALKSANTDSAGGAPGAFIESMMRVQYTSTPYITLSDDDFSSIGGDSVLGEGAYDESSCLRYVWGKLISSPKYQTLPTTDALAWSLDNAPMTTVATFLMAEGDLTLKWFGVPLRLFDRDLVMSLTGKTNQDDFGSPSSMIGRYPAGTLVFIVPDVEPYQRATGEIYLNITYRFKYFPNGANRFYRYNAPSTNPPVTSSGGGSELQSGPGFYFATRRYWDAATQNATQGRAVPFDGLSSLPSGVNVLLFPYGDYQDLFRARVDLTNKSLLN